MTYLVRLGGLGDLLVALPAIRLVRSVLPAERLVFVGRADGGLLLQEKSVVDFAASADEARWAPMIAAFSGQTPRRLDVDPEAAGLGPDDLVLGWFHGREEGRIRRPLFRFFFETTEEYFRRRGFVLPPFGACAGLPVREDGKTKKDHFAVIHPGSGSARKCWPLDRFLAVAAALAAREIGGLLVTGEAEGRLEAGLREASFPAGWAWKPYPPLVDLAALLSRADLYVGNDSGVTHLAAACGARVVALFRDEFKDAWRPAGDVRLLSAPDVADIPLSSVLSAV